MMIPSQTRKAAGARAAASFGFSPAAIASGVFGQKDRHPLILREKTSMFSNITISNYSKRNEVAGLREIELTELLGSIHRKMMKRLAGYAVTEGLSMTESLVLWKIDKLGVSRVSDIAAQVGLPPSTLTGVLDRLVAHGWLEREADPDDRRAVLMKSTTKLAEFTKSSMRASAKSLERSFRGLPPKLLDRLVADLASVLECLDKDEENQR